MALKDTLSKLSKRSSKTPPSLVTPIKAVSEKDGAETNGDTKHASPQPEAENLKGPKTLTPETEKGPKSARYLVIGAGARGGVYANSVHFMTNGIVAAVVEPHEYKRNALGKKYIWYDQEEPTEGQSFSDWPDFIIYEHARRKRIEDGETDVPPGVDGVFVCTRDEMHEEIVVKLAPLGLHIMCEKPLSTSLQSCINMYNAVKPHESSNVFALGHVLRYTPHNTTLRKVLLEDKEIGDISSVVHTEPVGWWHFAHAFVRGNWRNDKTTAPTLLTKSCHDVDLMLWLLCSPTKAGQGEPHLPATVASTGGIHHFKKSRKPAAAGDATNCTKCALGDEGCKYSAKRLYIGPSQYSVQSGHTNWPVNIVVPDIEDYKGFDARKEALLRALEEDWDANTPESEVSSRNWFGRCVYEADNNVNDEQFVTITWPESDLPAKHVTFHMVAQSHKVCKRFSHFYGETGEIYADSDEIKVTIYETGETRTYNPNLTVTTGHGGGDEGITKAFAKAVDHVKNESWDAVKARNEFLGCTLEDVLRSHVMVFAAEDARVNQKTVDWQSWWDASVQPALNK